LPKGPIEAYLGF